MITANDLKTKGIACLEESLLMIDYPLKMGQNGSESLKLSFPRAALIVIHKC